ncbi:MAG: polysaccharide deacetylase family protein [Bacteroidales bacterium]|nr:polysaccharide deacetylase family protein [Bacteroidales bacterium]
MKALYNFFRKFLSSKYKGHITKALYAFGIKPTVQKGNSPLRKGVVVFSADFEMAWAFRYSKRSASKAVTKGLEERNNVPIIIGLFDKYHIPCTWATVGHLMLTECKTTDEKAHSELPRPAYFENKNWEFTSGDWYDHDPASNLKTSPAWYASDLVDMILKSPVDHEIGCHTFSHIDMTYKNCPKQLAEAEILTCNRLAGEKGIKLKSMVFPGGTLGNFEVLKENGFTNYRKPLAYDVGLPVKDKHGLWAIPSSTGLDKTPYNWSKATYIKHIKAFLKTAARKRMVVHFWFHPSMNKWYLENVFPEILSIVNQYREDGEIDILTMQQVAEKMEL